MTEKIAVDVKQVEDALREIVAANPNRVYRTPSGYIPDGIAMCFYVHNAGTANAEPGCLIGKLAHKLGASLDSMAPFERGSSYVLMAGLFDFPHNSETELSRLGTLLNDVQGYQDRGTPWGEALRQAEAELSVSS